MALSEVSSGVTVTDQRGVAVHTVSLWKEFRFGSRRVETRIFRKVSAAARIDSWQRGTYVWDGDTDHLSNVIDVYIKRLREKLDLNYEEKDRLMISERGIGYGIKD